MSTSRRVLPLLAFALWMPSSAPALTWEVVAAHGVCDGQPALNAPIGAPSAIALNSSGKLYIADTRHARIRTVENGVISTIAGTGATGYDGDGVPGTMARINYPTGIAAGGDGTIYFVDQNNHRIRAVGPDGTIRTVAGDGLQGFGGDGGPATSARLSNATGIVADANAASTARRGGRAVGEPGAPASRGRPTTSTTGPPLALQAFEDSPCRRPLLDVAPVERP